MENKMISQHPGEICFYKHTFDCEEMPLPELYKKYFPGDRAQCWFNPQKLKHVWIFRFFPLLRANCSADGHMEQTEQMWANTFLSQLTKCN